VDKAAIEKAIALQAGVPAVVSGES
jgi:hypothetical protein